MRIPQLTPRILLVGMVGVALSLTLSSCDNLLDVEPQQDVQPEAAFSSEGGFESTLSSTYDDLQDVGYYGQFYMLYPEALADNAINLSGVARYDGPPQNAAREHLNRWGGHYTSINKANTLIAESQNFDEADEAFKERIRGEALFLRALNYFDLIRTKAYEPGEEVNGFTQGVILRTEPTRSAEVASERLPRAPTSEVYDQIETDLQNARSLLAGTKNGRFKANEAAAQALLAQVRLYRKDFEGAATTATAALETARDSLDADLLTEDEYVEAHVGETMSSALFSINMNPDFDGDATSVNESLSSLTHDPGSFNFQLLPTQDLIDAHADGDVRAELYETLPSGDTRINKYTQAVGSYTDNIPVIRAAEVLLIRAEARFENGNESGALEDVNTLRSARGLEKVSLSGESLIDEILKQKRLELAFEGERFFDLKRRGMDIPKPQVATPDVSLAYEDRRVLAPIPSGEVQLNGQLDQNPGY
ncbi:RagB/SusD family nutrient uptake outer membrane protein [Salinibacter grassmerensis]|uniref:RagB/SusD family nutrient uptake outer membrane protein n=1 Tax=Salinibacter grassmerensis TaxID=3040353 RepID=UPI0021E97A7F|nr:RagB/SusD family nutrient uptake outer membrane protein [Salinibacter grassmerensis]